MTFPEFPGGQIFPLVFQDVSLFARRINGSTWQVRKVIQNYGNVFLLSLPLIQVCSTQYESECWTRYEKHDVTDDVADCTVVKETQCDEFTSGYTTEQVLNIYTPEAGSLDVLRRT